MNRLLSVLSFALVVGCHKKEEVVATTPPEPAAVETAPALPAATAEAVLDLESLAVEEDFEAEAEKELTAENLSTKLDDLEKEIAAR
jgi:hypothetical protein